MLETLIPILALAIYATLFIWSVIYIGSCGLAGLKNAATIFKFSHFTIRGFSARRLAYLLSFISTLLVPLHWRADWQGDGYRTSIHSDYIGLVFSLSPYRRMQISAFCTWRVCFRDTFFTLQSMTVTRPIVHAGFLC